MTTPMMPRQRVLEALAYRPVDKIPLQVHPSPGGLYEHGHLLVELMQRCYPDFGPLGDLQVPVPPAEDFDADGRYHRRLTDAWGTDWEFRLYGVWGHRTGYPLADMARLATYRPPPAVRLTGQALAQARRGGATHRQTWFHVGGGASLFETMQSLRPYEDLLIDLAHDTPEVNRLADMLVEHSAVAVANALAIDADAFSVGDDFGTQQALILSPAIWRRFFKPRYQQLLAPLVKAGKHVLFHSCGCIGPLLDDLREVGASAIWPQLPLFDLRELARRCRDLGLAVQLHPDRGELMQRGTPSQVRDYMRSLLDAFAPQNGGSWLYLEIDPGFPWANVAALFEAALQLRGEV